LKVKVSENWFLKRLWPSRLLCLSLNGEVERPTVFEEAPAAVLVVAVELTAVVSLLL
jgi:hypothetical protein